MDATSASFPCIIPFSSQTLHYLERSPEEPPCNSPVTSSQRFLYGSLVANPQAFIDQQGTSFCSLMCAGALSIGRWQVVTDTSEVIQQSQYTAARE